jgi:hypothetical protein
MPERAIRFSVLKQGRFRSATWKCFAQTRKDDFYLACREFKGAMKVSFHETGKWHSGFDREFLDKKAPKDSRLLIDRFPLKWQEPPELSPGVILALRILVPEYVITVPKKEEKRSLVWIPSPPIGKTVEILIFLTHPEVKVSSWPGANTMGTSLVGKIDLESGKKVWVVYRIIDLPPLKVPSTKGKATFFRDLTPEEEEGRGLRAIGTGKHKDGSVYLRECLVTKVKRHK